MCSGLSRLKLNERFTLDRPNNIRKTRRHSWKLVKFRCIWHCCEYFLPKTVINRWNQLDQRAVGASGTNTFKRCLSTIRETRMSFFMD